MGMGYDAEENIGVGTGCLSDFFLALSDQLKFVGGVFPLPEGLSLEEVRRPNLVIGDPGIGKTCGIVSVINEINGQLPPDKQFKMKKILLGQTVVGSLSGIPVVNNTTGDVQRVQAPELPTVERDGEYGVLLLDEITTADEAQVQPALGLCDDTRNIGTYQLPEHWVVVAAGNGPSCANFLELHDMTLSRFIAYDIKYSYKKDWRPWAHAHGINELIIAFLNFKPEYIVKVVTSDCDKSGKQFPCPRTWTRLSAELKMRAAAGRPVSQNELQNFASRIIGIEAAREFAAFSLYNKSLTIKPEDVTSGKVKKADGDMKIEEFHILVQQINKCINKQIEETQDENGDFPIETYNVVANSLAWIISFKNVQLDHTIAAIYEIMHESPGVFSIVSDTENFAECCPQWEDFIVEYGNLIANPDVDIENLV